MFKKLSLAGAALAMSATALIPATPAAAQNYDRHYRGDRYDNRYDGGYRDYDRGYRDDRGYDNRRNYRGYNRSYRARCNNDTGTVVGAIAGGLLGNTVAGRGDRLLGTVLGAGAGALAGRAIDRSDDPRRCRR
ncbi:MAG: glycine zipper 2TM domain-containing protein [Sphingomonas sp.]|jgi:hypothetical protein|uniref:glycine zipper 2TM domain-containing protein n=1 Tax=Sphingomonas sp. TaxID=28214 RepID=UPI00356B28DF